MQYTRAQAAVEPKEGGEYAILDGKIKGRFLTLRQDEYIKMEWKFNDWKEYSIV
jgi:activator of HSP90 ATPase